VLRYAPVTNTLISPLLLAGLALFIKQWKRLAPLYLLAANGILVLLASFPTDRYRAAYFAVLMPLCAAVVRRRCGQGVGVDFFAPIQEGARAGVRAAGRIPLDLAPVAPLPSADPKLLLFCTLFLLLEAAA